MNTETTDVTDRMAEGWVFYDGECPLCLAGAERFGPMLTRRGFLIAPLQTPWVLETLNLKPDAPLTEMRVRLPDGTVYGGADALVALARRVWWGWPLFLFAKLPGALPLLRAGYVQLAANRNCLNGRCTIPAPRTGWPLILLPALVFLVRNQMPNWAFMWAMTLAIFYGCKWITWRNAARRIGAPLGMTLGYFFAWPGMDAEAFVKRTTPQIRPAIPLLRDWLFALVKLCAGVAMVMVAFRNCFGFGPLVVGWLGIVGVIMTLHFGFGDLLALAWRFAGVNCTPLMRRPIAAASLTEFWGRRWNTAFNHLAQRLVFKPLARGHGVMVGVVGVFIGSGLVHELVISMPARGGYGLPTAYFAIQGVGMLLERSPQGRRLGLGAGFRGWLFTAAVLIAPLGWICPPVFIHNVILPMLRAIGGN